MDWRRDLDGMEPSECEINSLDFLSDEDASSCMSEDNTTFSSHSSGDPRVHSDIDAVCSAVDALLTDVEHVSVMTPLDHLDWALALPLCAGISRPPEMMRRAVHRGRVFGHRGLEAYRQKTLASWFERKRVLDQPGNICGNNYLHMSVKCWGRREIFCSCMKCLSLQSTQMKHW